MGIRLASSNAVWSALWTVLLALLACVEVVHGAAPRSGTCKAALLKSFNVNSQKCQACYLGVCVGGSWYCNKEYLNFAVTPTDMQKATIDDWTMWCTAGYGAGYELYFEWTGTTGVDTPDAYAYIRYDAKVSGVIVPKYLCPWSVPNQAAKDAGKKANNDDTMKTCEGSFKYKWRVQYAPGPKFTIFVEAAQSGAGVQLYLRHRSDPPNYDSRVLPALTKNGDSTVVWNQLKINGQCEW